MSAPKFDGYGLHAEDCSCPRCEAGFRPTLMQRHNARLWALQRGQQAARMKRQIEAHDRHRAAIADTERLARGLAVIRPTPDQLAELKAIRERMFPK